MGEAMTEPQLVELEPQDCAVVREIVPMSGLPEFFGRAFHLTMASAAAQGRRVAGPPLGIYFGMPSDIVDVAAGFPVDAPVAPDGAVSPLRLPGGRAVQLLHLGPYDSMTQSYDRLFAWLRERNLEVGEVMWEAYLNEPDPDKPEATRTMITWPLR